MNERIKELAEQANAYETGHAYYRGEKKPENAVTLHTVDLELFAELIVRECVSIVAKRKDQAIDNGWNVDEAMSMAEMDLEEHFGVES